MDPDHLKAVPLFADMSEADRRRIATFATEDSAQMGTTLIREGDFSNDMLAIESGTADVLRDGQLIDSLGPGDVVGEIGVLERELRTASVVASSPVRLIRLTNWDVKRLPRETRDRLLEIARSRRPS